MNCHDVKLLIQPYADGELEALRMREAEEHFRACPACAQSLAALQSLKKSVGSDSLFFNAPNALRQNLRAQLRAQAGATPERKSWNWNFVPTASIGFAAACLALMLTVIANRPSAQQRLAQEVVAGHVRSLMANHTLDVVSTDRHTVKPWFNGKLDFSPPVKDLAAQDFPLIGGRLDYLDGHTTAALVFQRNKHVINLFIWPANETDSKPVEAAPIQGYSLVHWSEGGMVFWAVSDLNEANLMDFARDFSLTP
jgi:anti-sigma factor RsiW